MRKIINLGASVALVLSMLPAAVGAQTVTSGADLLPGQLVRSASSSTVYYIDSDMQRYVFPNVKVYLSWYTDFGGVKIVSDADLAELPLAGVVPYKAAKRLIKVQSDPRVYAVDEGGTLRWITSEQVAKALYGDDWAKYVDDLSDAFFIDYTRGEDIDDSFKFDRKRLDTLREIRETLRERRWKNIERRRGSDDERENEGYGRGKNAICHKGKATLYLPWAALDAHVKHGDAMGKCSGDNGGGNGGTDTTAPVVSDVVISNVTSVGAKITLKTNEDARVRAYYSLTSPVNKDTATSTGLTDSGKDHSLTLSSLQSNKTYYVVLTATDTAGNKTDVAQKSFTTTSADTTDPTVTASSIDTITATGAKVHVSASEDVTVKAYYGTSSPVNVSTAAHVDADTLDDSHDLTLTGLTADTTYYVKIVVKDAAGNDASVDEKHFTTLEVDTTDPTVEDLDVTDITVSGAKVSVEASEDVTVKVYYGTVSPVNVATATHVDSTTLNDEHTVTLSGLANTTTYYVKVVVRDAAGNETVASETHFTTL